MVLITLREDIFAGRNFAEEIFAEFNFEILALIREIKFRETYNYCMFDIF